MTKEEAVEQIKFMVDNIQKEPPTECDCIKEWLDTDKDIRNALDMAIKALEQEPVYFPPCVDCNTKMNEIREAYDNLKKQEPSEWQQDHAILKTHADGANEVIDRIKKAREEVANYSDFHREHLYKTNPNYDVEQGQYLAYEKCLQIIDDMIAEVEGTK